MTKNEYAERITALQPRLFKTALIYTGSEYAADEILAETIYKGLKNIKKLKNDDAFDGWIKRVLINECHTAYRYGKKFQFVDELPETATENFDALPLKDALSRLPKNLKDVVLIKYFWGCTIFETAKILNISQGTAATRLRKALELLKLDLGEEEKI